MSRKEDEIFYNIVDKKAVGKLVGPIPYLFDPTINEWVVDNDNILMDRVVGYDVDCIGSSDMMSRVVEISKEEAKKMIEKRNS